MDIHKQLNQIRLVSLYLDLIDHYMDVGMLTKAYEYIQRTNRLVNP